MKELNLLPLPKEVTDLFSQLKISARLFAHLRLVHDTAHRLLDTLADEFPALHIERELVLFGAATHDIGKCICTEELTHEGNSHESEGYALLLRLGVSEEKARFALTHSTWNEQSSIEELLVSLADKIWKGCRNQELEDSIVAKIASETQVEKWKVFGSLDDIIQGIAKSADKRLNWQNQNTAVSQVGIFWLYRHEIIFAHKVPLADGTRYGNAVTGTKDHADYWEELRASGKLTQPPPELREEYFSIPRGRVVYHSDTDRFFIYHGNNATKSDFAKVRKAFNLPKAKTICEQDLHYCDLNDDEWKREFET